MGIRATALGNLAKRKPSEMGGRKEGSTSAFTVADIIKATQSPSVLIGLRRLAKKHKLDPNITYMEWQAYRSLAEPVVGGRIMDRICPAPKDATEPVSITIINNIKDNNAKPNIADIHADRETARSALVPGE